MSVNFWDNVDNQLNHIERSKPQTARELIDLMNKYRTDYGISDGEAFFEGSGGDRSLMESLREAGWRVEKMVASYYWMAKNPRTGSKVTYIEGDVYSQDRMPVEAQDTLTD